MNNNPNPKVLSLRGKLADIRNKIQALQEEEADCVNALAEELSEFKPGDLIEWQTRRGTSRGMVMAGGFSLWAGETSSCTVRRVKKDGSLGTETVINKYHNAKLVEEGER